MRVMYIYDGLIFEYEIQCIEDFSSNIATVLVPRETFPECINNYELGLDCFNNGAEIFNVLGDLSDIQLGLNLGISGIKHHEVIVKCHTSLS